MAILAARIQAFKLAAWKRLTAGVDVHRNGILIVVVGLVDLHVAPVVLGLHLGNIVLVNLLLDVDVLVV